MGALEPQVVQGLEHHRRLGLNDLLEVGRVKRSGVLQPARQHGSLFLDQPAVSRAARLHLEMDPGAGVAAVVHGVVQQAGVPADGDALARAAQVGLGRDRILVITYLVAEVCDCLYQRDLHIGRIAFLPVRHDRGEPVEHQTPEAAVVFGQVVDQRGGQVLGWALVFG